MSKSFFETKDKKGRVRLKTFLAGWSQEMASGELSRGMMVHVNGAEHLNVVFEIQEDRLVGRMIVPSFIKEGQDCLLRDSVEAKKCRARWPIVISINIKNHFYYERSKDARGRETDVYVENSNRSHWSARPLMNLDFKTTDIRINSGLDTNHRATVDAVEDIEIDSKTGFIGFTATISDSYYKYIGTDYERGLGTREAKTRFNFLKFEHDPTFKATPYRHANAKYLNVLHMIGKQIDGDPANQVLYGAHWDTRKKHTIWLHDFPAEYVKLGEEVIELWNDAFEKVGHGRPLEARVSDRKYAFDLRYPSIVWVQDRRLSYGAPLGVGMALSDVRNGEIKWGGVTIWGGMLEEIINRYSPSSATAGVAESTLGSKPIIQLALMEPKRNLPISKLPLPEGLVGGTSFEALRAQLEHNLSAEQKTVQALVQNPASKDLVAMAHSQQPTSTTINPVNQLSSSFANPAAITLDDVKKRLTQRQETLDLLFQKKGSRSAVDEMASGLLRVSQRYQMLATQNSPIGKNADYIQDLIKMPKLNESLSYLPTYNRNGLQAMLSNRNDISKKQIIELLQSHQTFHTGKAGFCTERRLSDLADSYAFGISQHNIDKVKAVRSLIKDLLLHEVGHMLGLGHNFKENILPKPGSVPNLSAKVGLKKPFSMAELEKQAKDNFKNYTTVMGYKHGITDVLMDEKDLMPGPADLVSLEYLYNQRYPVYPKDARGEGDFEFAQLTTDGWINDNLQKKNQAGQTVQYRPAFFPACNDFTASMGMDPYCARWDRGYDAATIVKNHFESYRGNLISQLNAFTDTVKGDSFWMHEYYMWSRSLDTFSRVRIFYDYMRQKYESEIRAMVQSGSETGIQNLLQFSETCRKMDANIKSGTKQPIENAYLQTVFEKNPEFRDLCVAGSIMVSELDQLMQLPGKDYTKVDYFNQYVSMAMTGGEAGISFGRAFGTWKELARIPIKISSLMTLTSPFPFSTVYGWAMPIAQYSREDGAYHISTMYPKEYTSAVASGAEMNLNMGNAELDQSTTIGRTVLAMGYFLFHQLYSNDILVAGAPYIDNIRTQTEFRYSYTVIEVEKENEDGKAIGRRFTGTAHNWYSRGPEKIPEIYIYTNDRVVMRPPPGSFIMPISPIRWYSKSGGYFYGIKMDYTDEFFDRLKTNSVRRTLNETYQEVVKKCIQGVNRNGLRFFFNKDVAETVFPGFEFPDTIADREDSKNRFLRSVEAQFDRYYKNEGNFSPAPDRAQCEEAIRGQALVVMAASVLNGYYLPGLFDFLEKETAW